MDADIVKRERRLHRLRAAAKTYIKLVVLADPQPSPEEMIYKLTGVLENIDAFARVDDNRKLGILTDANGETE